VSIVTRRPILSLIAGLAWALTSASASAQPASADSTEIPAHPDQLSFAPIEFEPPDSAAHRVELSNGMIVFIAEDKTLPLIDISVRFRAGRWLTPAGKEGLAALTGGQMRQGGTESLSAEELDERLDFLAAQVGTGIGETATIASLNCLSDNFDESFAVFVEILKSPRFQQDRLELAREQALQGMKKRNDDTSDIEMREARGLLYGEGFFVNRHSTQASVMSLTREDLLAFHRGHIHPSQAVAAVSGAFDRDEMIAKLEQAFAEWPYEASPVIAIPDATHSAAPGLYRVEKDVNQGRVSLLLPLVRHDHPDVYALELMNDILGGSGFTSRIVRSVRSDEGLAYSAGSSLRFGVHYTGSFRAFFQSKSRSVAYATSLVLDELRRIRDEPVTEEELEIQKNGIIETFPSTFASKYQSMGLFADDELIGRASDYWKTYRDRIRAVTVKDIQRVAREHIDPSQLVILAVGNQTDIDSGDGEHALSMLELAGGQETTLALPDPMTMKRP
jgi:zinc protease